MKSLSLSKPHLIIMVGAPGAGKSFFAERFSRTFATPVVSWQKIRQVLFNHPVYNEEEDAIVERVALHMMAEFLKARVTVLYEPSIQSQTHRQNIAEVAKKIGYETIFVWVQTDKTAAKTRGLKNGLTAQQYKRYESLFVSPKNAESPVVISGRHTFASQLKIVLVRLSLLRTDRKPTTRTRSSSRPSAAG